VALSLTSRPVGVTHHCALWSPDFPPVDSAGSPRRDIHTKSTGDHPVRSGPIPLTLYPAWRPGLYSSSSERPYKDSFHRFPSNLVFRIRFPKSVKILWRNASFHPFRAFLIVDTIRLAKRMGVFLSTLVKLCERNNSIA